MIRIFIIAALVLASTAAQASPSLKHDVSVAGEIVRIGDLVDNAGDASSVAVFRAPDPGSTGTVPIERVLEALRPHGVIGLDVKGATEVTVRRMSRVIPRAEIEARIARDIANQLGVRDPKSIGVTFDLEPQPLHVDPAATADLRTERLTYDRRTRRFNVIILLPGEHRNWRFAGIAEEVFEAATLTRPVTRGEVLRDVDVAIEKRAKAELSGDVIADAQAVVGQAARRALRAGQPLRQGDLMRPELVHRNEPVMILYQVPGIVLTLRGKAIDAGSEGDVVSVLNLQSKRTVQGVVTGDGRVLVSPPAAARVASVNPSVPGERDQ
jgi:flagella basal body P-ring formation protein FlgA